MNITVTPNGTQPPRVIQVAEGAVTSVNGQRGDITITAASVGALDTSAAASTVTSETAFGQASAVGTATTYAREDHTHGTPTAPNVPSAATTVTAQTSFGTTSNAGAASTYSRGDHSHGTPTLPTASTSTAGVVQLDGTAADIAALGIQAAGSTGKAADAGHVHPTTGVLPTAGGTMTGGINSSLATTSSAGIGVFVSGDAFDRGRMLASGQIEMGSGAAAREVVLSRTAANQLSLTTSDFRIATAGRGLMVAEGTNAKMGTATLNGTTNVTINTTSVTATSRIFLTTQAASATYGAPVVATRTAGTSFAIKSTVTGDTSTVAWQIVEPA